jgi:thiamine-monophosphate kinase
MCAREPAEDAADPDAAAARARYLRPSPRVRLGLLLGRNQAATACVDLSDGLADGLRQIARASGAGIVVDAEALPVDPGVCAWFGREGRDPVSEVVTGGDDYELLFTVSPRRQGRLRAVAQLARGLALTRIGTVTKDGSVVLRRDGRDEALPESFAHFRAEGQGPRAEG